ncbi:MAG: outer membrane beta-barrel protein [Bacteroidota bacterium]
MKFELDSIVQPLKTKKISLQFILPVIFLVGFIVNAFSQVTDTIIPVDQDPQKTLRKIDIKKFTRNGFNFWQDQFSGHWAGVDVGFNMFLNEDYTGYDTEFMDNDVLRSNSTYANLIQQSIGLQKHRNTIGLVTGLGLHLQSYRLDDNTTIYRDENDVIFPRTLVFDDNQKSKLSIVSISIPLLAEFQIPVNHYENRIYLSAGVFGSYRLSSHTKIKYRIERKEKLKVPDHYSLHNFKYGLMFRTGYRWLNIFATYDLVTLFKEDKGPELTPFTVGITLIQF